MNTLFVTKKTIGIHVVVSQWTKMCWLLESTNLKEILNFLDTTEKNSQMRNTGM